jgi:hypothetical protein
MIQAVEGAHPSAGAVEKFLTPEAMLTPGAAGGITMLIANALANNFSLPIAYIGLGLSFLFGLLVMASARKWWMRAIYYVLNSLIIFCVAFGSGNIVASSAKSKSQVGGRLSWPFVAEAYADTAQDARLQQLVRLQTVSEQLDAQYGSALKKLADLSAQGASKEDIAAQSTIVHDLLSKKNENSSEQASILNSLGDPATGAPNITKNSPSQILGGPNSVINNPSHVLDGVNSKAPGNFFNQWKF